MAVTTGLLGERLIIWLIALIVTVLIGIAVGRHINNQISYKPDYLPTIGYIWLVGGGLFVLAGIAGSIWDTGRGWYWAASALALACICSIVFTATLGIIERWTPLYGGAIGLFSPVTLLISIIIFSRNFSDTSDLIDRIALKHNISVVKGVLLFFVLPTVVGAIMGFIVEKSQDAKAAERQQQAEKKQREEYERAEKQRTDEQWRNKTKSEIDNLFKW